MITKLIIDPKGVIHYYKNGDFHTQFGVLKEPDIKTGIVKSNLDKEFLVFDASFIDNIHQIKRGPAIAHYKDIGLIISTTGVGVKSKVVDAGSGCGNLSASLARIGCNVTTYEINPEFPDADVALVIGANDITNPAARHDQKSPIYGMPILDVDKAKTVIVCKRSMKPGFAGIDNDLYLHKNCRMLFGDAKDSISKVVERLKAY